ncbi:hypothetical protein BFW01_g4660 [Lasiodiplodia theobromae]|nr:hypothetical protein BFW01_g4660 [Lasiodiplodia theobromae]
MEGEESSIHEMPDHYNHSRSYPSRLNDQLASQPFGCDYARDLFGIGSSFTAELPAEQNTGQSGNSYNTRASNNSSGFVFGGANDFSSPVGPYELFVPPIQDHASTAPQENMQPQLSLMPMQSRGFPQLNTVSDPIHPFQNTRSRSPHLPALTLQTGDIQGNTISSRRPSWQSNTSSSVPSQFTGTTPSSGTRITPFSPTQPSFGTPSSFHPPSALDPSSAYLGHNKNGRSLEEAVSYKNSNDSDLTHELFSMRDLFADPRRIQVNPSPTINRDLQFPSFENPFGHPTKADMAELVPPALNPHGIQPPALSALPTQPHPLSSQHPQPPHQSNVSPHRVLQQTRSPRPHASCDNRCPRCHHLFTSKPRDLGRNIRRHLQLSCPNRDATVPRLSCSVPGCRKTFVRDCAKRVHEEKQHGILRSSRRGGGAAEGLPMRRALSAA